MLKLGTIVKIDGIDGAGKTTLVNRLVALYREHAPTVIGTREFGTRDDHNVNPLAVGVSQWLYENALDPALTFDDAERELAMMLASRRQNRLVLPRLRRTHELIISDRSSVTNWAYAHTLGSRYFDFLEWALTPVLQEDLILWIDIDPYLAFERDQAAKAALGRKTDAVEEKGLTFQLAVAAAYGQLMTGRSNALRLDGALTLEALLEQAEQLMRPFVNA